MDCADPHPSPPPLPRRPVLGRPVGGDPIPVVRRSTRQVVRPTIVAPPPPSWRPPDPIPLVHPVARRPRRRVVTARFPSVAPLLLTVAVFGGMMAVSFGHLTYALLANADVTPKTDDQLRAQLVSETAVAEGIDTALVLAGLLVAGRPRARRPAADPLLTWLVSAPGFVLFLGVNVGFALALRTLAGSDPDPDQMPVDFGLGHGWGWTVLLVCAQPALVEELFFRYLLYGHLRSHVGLHAAVWVTAVVFGMAHLGNPIGWPVLIVLGVGLGYARAYSGSLALPVVLHFVHNLSVTALNDAMFR